MLYDMVFAAPVYEPYRISIADLVALNRREEGESDEAYARRLAQEGFDEIARRKRLVRSDEERNALLDDLYEQCLANLGEVEIEG